MADGDEVSGRSKCQPCSRKGRTNAAVKFCDTCQRSFCSVCLVHHDAIYDHLHIQGAEVRGTYAITEESTELCDEHKMPILLYCNEEDRIGCVTCMDADHKHCKQVIFLPASATALLQDIDVTSINEMLATTKQKLETIKLKQQPHLATLIEDKEKCLKKVNDDHIRFLEKLNEIFRSTTDAINQKFEVMSAEIERNILKVEISLAEFDLRRIGLQQFQNNHVQRFIEVKKCQKYIKESKAVSTEAAADLKIEGMDAPIDQRLETLLTELKYLATIVRRGPIQVKKKYQIDVSFKEDTATCQITASCILPDSSILLVDFENRKLKRLDDETLTIIDTFSMEDKPIGVCCIDEENIATTTGKQKLLLLAILPKLRKIRTLRFNHHCGYVARHKKNLFITDVNKNLYVYTMQGSLMRKFTTDTLGKDVFSTARHVVANDTGDKLFVTDWENGLITINREWMTVDRGDTLKSSGTRGVCLDEVGGVYVCGNTAHIVAYINQEGKHVNDVLTENDGLLKPKSVCFEGTRRRIFVSQEDSNQMIVCEMI